jgi:hypothetical protein
MAKNHGGKRPNPGPKRNVAQLPADGTRRLLFLQALENSGGSWSAAARAASPHLGDKNRNKRWPPGLSTWRALYKRDPEFASEVNEVLERVKENLVAEMHRRSVEGVLQPVYGKGQRIFEPALDEEGRPILDEEGKPDMRAAVVRKFSDTILLARARALMPELYGEKREVNVNVNHRRSGAWEITSQDVRFLTEDERKNLLAIMEKVRVGRGEMESNLAAIEHQPEEYAEFEEVDEAEEWELAHEGESG